MIFKSKADLRLSNWEKLFGLEKNQNLHLAEAHVGRGEEGAGRQRLCEAILTRFHPLCVAEIVNVLPHRRGHLEKSRVGELLRCPGSASFRLLWLLFFHSGSNDVVEDVVERKRFVGMAAHCGTALGTVTGTVLGDTHGL